MSTQLFEGEDHAVIYQKHRFPPPQELLNLIFSYLEEKKEKPYDLAVDVGCGSGQSTQILVPHFTRVLGTDISKAQIQQAKQAHSNSQVSYCVCPAEDLPLDDGSVDLLTAFTAAHWFDLKPFMKELERVLKPGGCVSLSSYTPKLKICYGDCTEILTEIFNETQDVLRKYANEKLNLVLSSYQEIFDLVPFSDKKRIVFQSDEIPFTLSGLMGFLQSFSMFQTFKNAEPEAAEVFLHQTQNRRHTLQQIPLSSKERHVYEEHVAKLARTERFLECMKVSSLETPIGVSFEYVCVLACKTPKKAES